MLRSHSLNPKAPDIESGHLGLAMCKTECPPKLVADFAKLRGLAKAGSMAEFKASLRKMVRCDEKCIILSIARHVVCQGVGFGIGTRGVAHLYDLDRADPSALLRARMSRG